VAEIENPKLNGLQNLPDCYKIETRLQADLKEVMATEKTVFPGSKTEPQTFKEERKK
jgi:hypothetical protein